MNQIEMGISKALAYADVFDFPLTQEEIFAWYIGKRAVSRPAITTALVQMSQRQMVDRSGVYYCLPGKEQLVVWRKNKLRSSTEKYVRAKRMATLLAKAPGVRGIFLTGSAAVDNAPADDDIDLMIITQNSRLWTTRLWITGMLEMMGVRRQPEQAQIQNRFCVNLYLDETEMTVEPEFQNLYTAHEVVLAKSLWERKHLSARFLQANRWVRDYLPNTVIPTTKYPNPPLQTPGILEKVCYQLQKMYMRQKMTRERVSGRVAYFHPRDMAKIVLGRYDQKLKDYAIN